MPELVTLTEDGPLGSAGTQVWVDDASDVEQKARKAPAKAAPKRGLKTTSEPVDKV